MLRYSISVQFILAIANIHIGYDMSWTLLYIAAPDSCLPM